jgi:hypothetical protein
MTNSWGHLAYIEAWNTPSSKIKFLSHPFYEVFQGPNARSMYRPICPCSNLSLSERINYKLQQALSLPLYFVALSIMEIKRIIALHKGEKL